MAAGDSRRTDRLVMFTPDAGSLIERIYLGLLGARGISVIRYFHYCEQVRKSQKSLPINHLLFQTVTYFQQDRDRSALREELESLFRSPTVPVFVKRRRAIDLPTDDAKDAYKAQTATSSRTVFELEPSKPGRTFKVVKQGVCPPKAEPTTAVAEDAAASRRRSLRNDPIRRPGPVARTLYAVAPAATSSMSVDGSDSLSAVVAQTPAHGHRRPDTEYDRVVAALEQLDRTLVSIQAMLELTFVQPICVGRS